jgi:DNA ligase-1
MAPSAARLADLVATSRDVAAESGRKAKVDRLSRHLRSLTAQECTIAATYLAGELPQGRIGIGPSRLTQATGIPPASRADLTIIGLDLALSRIASLSGKGSQAERLRSVETLFSRMTAPEQAFAARLLLGELRQGAVAGLALEAIARVSEAPIALVRRAAMLTGRTHDVAAIAFEKGAPGLAQVSLRLFTPIAPMLAQPTEGLEDALSLLTDPYLEFKLDGARVQVHKKGDEVRVFSRQGKDVSTSAPEVVEAISRAPATELVLDGEVLVLRGDGRPQPFQTTMRRFGRRHGTQRLRRELPLRAFFFDCIHLDGHLLIDDPATERFAALTEALPGPHLIPRCRARSRSEASAFLEQAMSLGHEGLMAKDPHSAYEAGGRGSHWLKVKRVHTLDLVVLAAEWGSGRRQAWLSNLHLGARGPGDRFLMLGKTFKGLTDALLAWQTEALLAREIARDGRVVQVRPELVVEVAFNELQESSQYPAGLALRFARVRRYRSDKSVLQADTIATVRALFERQIAYQAPEIG